MGRGYGNAARYERQAFVAAGFAVQVRAASVEAATMDAVAGVADDLAAAETVIASQATRLHNLDGL